MRAATIIDKIAPPKGPVNTKFAQTGGGTYNWVEMKPKPVTSLTFGSVTLDWAKVAGSSSSPRTEAVSPGGTSSRKWSPISGVPRRAHQPRRGGRRRRVPGQYHERRADRRRRRTRSRTS